LPERLTVYHRFDEGFSSRFGGVRNSESTIRGYQNVVTAMLLDIFRLNVITMSPVEQYRSITDKCKRGMVPPGTSISGLLNRPCECIGYCDSLDVFWGDMLEQLEESTGIYDFDEIYDLRIAWPGHLIYEDDGRPSRSWWYSNGTVLMSFNCVMRYYNNNNIDIDGVRNQHINVLLHEIGHQIGAEDHYCYEDNGGRRCSNIWHCYECANQIPPDCIMSDDWENIEIMDLHRIFCRECASRSANRPGTIRTHLAEHFN
jgi:hypothetical protein